MIIDNQINHEDDVYYAMVKAYHQEPTMSKATQRVSNIEKYEDYQKTFLEGLWLAIDAYADLLGEEQENE